MVGFSNKNGKRKNIIFEIKQTFRIFCLNCNNLRFTSYILLNSTKERNGKTISRKINQTNFIFNTLF